MPLYWAQFEKGDSGAIFRIDTRVYLEDVKKCGEADIPIGAVVAKNPGSALPSSATSTTLQRIDLANDKLLPTVRSIVAKAYRKAKRIPPANSFVQVLNLFYLCDEDFDRAIRAAKKATHLKIDPAETKRYPWVMYLWGEFENRTVDFIRRFADLDSKNHFYFDKKLSKVVRTVPGKGSFAKHTQGLIQEPVIQHLASQLLEVDSDE